jgi:hypothetical protein
MSIYNPAIPQANDDLSDSQGQILQNFDKANSSFGIDHYNFANLTADNGKHNQITTPAFIDSPPTALPPVTIAAEPKMYAFQDSANAGVLNYSRGPSNAVPTPLTSIHSPVTPIITTANVPVTVFDFTGLARSFCIATACDMTGVPGVINSNIAFVIWTGSDLNFLVMAGVNSGTIRFQTSGSILQLVSTPGAANNLYWTLDFLRMS